VQRDASPRRRRRGRSFGAVLVLVLAAVLAPQAHQARSDEPLLVEPFESEAWHDGWIDWRTADDNNTDIVPGYHGNGLSVTIPPNQRRGTGPHFRLPDGVEEAWFRYHLRLDSWDAITSGKLPGFAGAPSSTAKGCFPSTPEQPGWSARMQFDPVGSDGSDPGQVPLGYYVYHVDQPGDCGETMLWSTGAHLDQDRWYCIEGHVRLNQPGAGDGLLEAWVDGHHVFARDDIQFRRADEAWLAVRTFWLDVYFGGSTVPNDRTLRLRIDDLEVSTDGRIGCLTRFTDDDENPHENDIEWLFDAGYVYGCGGDLYCPDRTLSRAEVIAVLDRILQPPAATADAFSDDDGHWAEAAINRLAPLGIVLGCGEDMVCPDEPVTRGQLAAFLARAFAFPAGNNAFVDDDGSIFEPAIDALSAAGITRGCTADHTRYCPRRSVPRDEAATLLARAAQWSGAAP
jgi:hypothetical protein